MLGEDQGKDQKGFGSHPNQLNSLRIKGQTYMQTYCYSLGLEAVGNMPFKILQVYLPTLFEAKPPTC